MWIQSNDCVGFGQLHTFWWERSWLEDLVKTHIDETKIGKVDRFWVNIGKTGRLWIRLWCPIESAPISKSRCKSPVDSRQIESGNWQIQNSSKAKTATKIFGPKWSEKGHKTQFNERHQSEHFLKRCEWWECLVLPWRSDFFRRSDYCKSLMVRRPPSMYSTITITITIAIKTIRMSHQIPIFFS